MALIQWVVVYSTDSANPAQDSQMLASWEKHFHFLIRLDGVIEPGRQIEGPAIKGYNPNAVHVAVAGRDSFRKSQLAALETLCQWLHDEYPGAYVVGDREIGRGTKKPGPDLDLGWLKAKWNEWSKRGKLQ